MDNDIGQGLEELYHQATTPLYKGSKTSIVSTTIVIVNMCVGFGVSNNFTLELLHYLSEDLLPEGYKLPNSHYTAAKTIQKLGLDYNIIHACLDGCVLSEGDHTLLEICRHRSKSRCMEGSNSIPAKVIRYFPLIPRLKRMWRSPELATMVTGYTKHVSDDGIMRRRQPCLEAHQHRHRVGQLWHGEQEHVARFSIGRRQSFQVEQH